MVLNDENQIGFVDADRSVRFAAEDTRMKQLFQLVR